MRSLRLCGVVHWVRNESRCSPLTLLDVGVPQHPAWLRIIPPPSTKGRLRHGASLAGIGAVLRHRSPRTTAHYAKVDFGLLSEIAQPWPGATVITDAWQGYRWLEKSGYIHDRRSQRAASARGEDLGELLPGVHRIASLAKRWLLRTHQGAVDSAHLPSYLDEFVFRFNRRRSRSRGMLFYRVLAACRS